MIFFGVIGKFGALFATIPDPVIGKFLCMSVAAPRLRQHNAAHVDTLNVECIQTERRENPQAKTVLTTAVAPRAESLRAFERSALRSVFLRLLRFLLHLVEASIQSGEPVAFIETVFRSVETLP